jgi:hypothetical protein
MVRTGVAFDWPSRYVEDEPASGARMPCRRILDRGAPPRDRVAVGHPDKLTCEVVRVGGGHPDEGDQKDEAGQDAERHSERASDVAL